MTLLITYGYFRDETNVSQNFDDKIITNPIQRAQNTLSFLIGKAFYNEIVEEFESVDFVTGDNGSLFDPYIKQYLAWQAYEYYLIRSDFYESRTGLRKFNDENSEILPATEKADYIRSVKQWVAEYKGQMLMYIKQEQRIDPSKYPLYRDCGEKQGSGFHITAITAKDNRSKNINRIIRNNGD
jgi:hypothetical protein